MSLLLLAGRNTRVRSIVRTVPIGAVRVATATQAWTRVVVVSSIPEVPRIVTTPARARRAATTWSIPAFSGRSLDVAVFVDDIAAVSVVHPCLIRDFFPVTAEAVLAEIWTLVSSSAGEPNATTGRCKASVWTPAVVSTGT